MESANRRLAHGMADRVVDGLAFRFTRRRYGRKIYTWAEYYVSGDPDMTESWRDCGDPWPSARIPKADLVAIAGDLNLKAGLACNA